MRLQQDEKTLITIRSFVPHFSTLHPRQTDSPISPPADRRRLWPLGEREGNPFIRVVGIDRWMDGWMDFPVRRIWLRVTGVSKFKWKKSKALRQWLRVQHRGPERSERNGQLVIWARPVVKKVWRIRSNAWTELESRVKEVRLKCKPECEHGHYGNQMGHWLFGDPCQTVVLKVRLLGVS